MNSKKNIFGAQLVSPDTTRFRVWAPTARDVSVELVEGNRQIQLVKTDDGMFAGEAPSCGAGSRYFYRIDDGDPRPDPASRFQPEGVHGPSQVVDVDFQWSDEDWKGVARHDLIVYELHIGTFTSQGTFLSAIDRLDELVELGVTAIELMPVATSAGRWNWGYDGVNLFAPMAAYGTPEHLRRFVDAAHAKGLAVILDVVFNHLGPEGNYLADVGPYLSLKHQTVWGAAPNFDDPQYGAMLRDFIISAALIWLDEYHFDGLRVDAIHCMRDDSDTHIAIDMSREIRQWSNETGRPVTLIAESNVYDPNMLDPIEKGGVGFDAEWCDDFLHSVFAVVRPGEQLCHRSYQSTDLKQTLEKGYIYRGTLSVKDQREQPTKRVDTSGLIYSIQHHDFIGNHPLGKRLHQLTDRKTQRAAAALLMLSPAIPMMFMGEEFCCEQPFQFFVDFGDEALRQGVVEGRKREYPQHDWSGGVLPTDPVAFEQSKIGSIADGDSSMRDWYIKLINARKQWRALGLLSDEHLSVIANPDSGLYILHYRTFKAFANVVVRLTAHGEDAKAIELPLVEAPIVLDSLPGVCEPNELTANHAKVFFDSLAD